MKKILFFVPRGVGGAERVTITIAKLIDKSKYDVKFVILGYNNSDIVQFIPSEFEVIYLNMNRMRENSFYKVYKVIKKEKPEFVFSSLRFICIQLLLICKFLCRNTRAVVRAQISPIYLNGRTWHDQLLKFAYPFAHKIVAQTEEMKAEMVKHYGLDSDKIQVLYNPVDINTIESKIKETSPFKERDCYIYVVVGRCAHQKGYDILIEAMRKVVDYNETSHLYILGKMGDDAYSKLLCDLVDKHNLNNNVHFAGFNDNPYKFVCNANCFVLSSRNEGLPNVLLEALYLKKPVVSTTCIPIIERLVHNGVNGLTVESENVDALSKAMIDIQSLVMDATKVTYSPASALEYNNLFT